MTPRDIRQSVERLTGDRARLLSFIRAHRAQLGAGVNVADWDPVAMDDTTLLMLVGFGLLALWQWTESQSTQDVSVPEPLRFLDGGNPAPLPSPAPSPQPTPQPQPQPPTQGGDQVDPSQVIVVGGSPDFRGWPIVTQLAIAQIEPSIVPAFADPGWPDIIPPGFDGPIQYTICAGGRVGPGGAFVMAGIIEMWRGKPDAGNNDAGNFAAQLWQNWWYYVPELAGYLPRSGDQIAMCVCSGDLRQGKGPFSSYQRSNIVLVTVP